MDRRLLEHFDWSIFWVALGITAIGIINLYSATQVAAMQRLFFLQLAFVVVGLVALAVTTFLDYRLLEQFAYPIWGTAVALLGLVLIVGAVRQGSRSWFSVLGLANFQPMELGKLALIITLARYFHNRQGPFNILDLIKPGLLVAVPVVLILLQPDWGGAALYLAISGSVVLYVGVTWFSLGVLTTGGVTALPMLFFFVLTSRQQDRIRVFLNPELDPLGRGYNTIQSKIAVGAGQVFGRGFLNGTQSKLRFLPAHHTDFIFSVLAEEWGFFGCVIVLGFLFALLLVGVRVVHRAKDNFGSLLAFGIVAMFFWQIAVNIGGALGLLPVTGVTLPFLSYGGSSLIVNFAAVGLLLNVSMRRFMF